MTSAKARKSNPPKNPRVPQQQPQPQPPQPRRSSRRLLQQQSSSSPVNNNSNVSDTVKVDQASSPSPSPPIINVYVNQATDSDDVELNVDGDESDDHQEQEQDHEHYEEEHEHGYGYDSNTLNQDGAEDEMKKRCDGIRPMCGFCCRRGLPCVYLGTKEKEVEPRRLGRPRVNDPPPKRRKAIKPLVPVSNEFVDSDDEGGGAKGGYAVESVKVEVEEEDEVAEKKTQKRKNGIVDGGQVNDDKKGKRIRKGKVIEKKNESGSTTILSASKVTTGSPSTSSNRSIGPPLLALSQKHKKSKQTHQSPLPSPLVASSVAPYKKTNGKTKYNININNNNTNKITNNPAPPPNLLMLPLEVQEQVQEHLKAAAALLESHGVGLLNVNSGNSIVGNNGVVEYGDGNGKKRKRSMTVSSLPTPVSSTTHSRDERARVQIDFGMGGDGQGQGQNHLVHGNGFVGGNNVRRSGSGRRIQPPVGMEDYEWNAGKSRRGSGAGGTGSRRGSGFVAVNGRGGGRGGGLELGVRERRVEVDDETEEVYYTGDIGDGGSGKKGNNVVVDDDEDSGSGSDTDALSDDGSSEFYESAVDELDDGETGGGGVKERLSKRRKAANRSALKTSPPRTLAAVGKKDKKKRAVDLEDEEVEVLEIPPTKTSLYHSIYARPVIINLDEDPACFFCGISHIVTESPQKPPKPTKPTIDPSNLDTDELDNDNDNDDDDDNDETESPCPIESIDIGMFDDVTRGLVEGDLMRLKWEEKSWKAEMDEEFRRRVELRRGFLEGVLERVKGGDSGVKG
ncbi:hypothetical protein HDU76_003553 [Blyttiomyces sp. JEL0837]|nr:hypothetical protein HDU76_003553 [Blyttiomyces sp. JEL0837]